MLLFGILKPVDINALRYASYLSLPKQATSPVEAISTPRTGSAPESLEKLNCGTLTPTEPGERFVGGYSVKGTPIIALVAISMRSTPMTFDTKGNERDARTLHSITLMSLSLAMN
ncbi:hypothetical protein RRF57_000018 [Xylaria bambusicola]|uniref:Uncharacterized protein n=1 Tax=Xylaria bambusicola TaxID=326684 RepID=A0AAN7YZ77_9PEZI